jgi:hypothetical protein
MLGNQVVSAVQAALRRCLFPGCLSGITVNEIRLHKLWLIGVLIFPKARWASCMYQVFTPTVLVLITCCTLLFMSCSSSSFKEVRTAQLRED